MTSEQVQAAIDHLRDRLLTHGDGQTGEAMGRAVTVLTALLPLVEASEAPAPEPMAPDPDVAVIAGSLMFTRQEVQQAECGDALLDVKVANLAASFKTAIASEIETRGWLVAAEPALGHITDTTPTGDDEPVVGAI